MSDTPTHTSTLNGPQGAALREAWGARRTDIRSNNQSLNQLIAKYPEQELEERASRIFEHICDRFDARRIPSGVATAIWEEYANAAFVPPDIKATKEAATAAANQIDAELARYVLREIETLRPTMSADADLFVGKVIQSSIEAYAAITGQRYRVGGGRGGAIMA